MAGFNPAAMQQALMQNPEMMQQIMSVALCCFAQILNPDCLRYVAFRDSPMMQGLMDNPELIQSLMMMNPEMKAVIDRNPQLAHVLNDRNLLRQSMQVRDLHSSNLARDAHSPCSLNRLRATRI